MLCFRRPSSIAKAKQFCVGMLLWTTTPSSELYEARNYYSLMAILDGLRKYIAVGSNIFRDFAASRTITPAHLIPPKILPLLDPSHNFVSYRQRYD
ncbi:hypothetical protein N7505_007678 [Penicillium chrysogenum]|uniref:Uncharacterized protein n=1 Tax=Penicillium chrysogenum TaxID=5076 RepID=A0ABQ8WEA8_PENCH|nr:hypothetical protein N7505_007678 [Penicillium chrysogenum]